MTVLLAICKGLGILLGAVLGLLVLLIAIVLLLSFLKARLVLEYNGDFRFQVRYLFLAIPKKKNRPKPKTVKDGNPPPEEKQPGASEKAPEKRPPSEKKEKNLFEKTVEGLSFSDYLEILKRIFRRVIRKITIENFTAKIRIGGDAYQTALTYGKLNAALYPLLGSLYSAGALRNATVDIHPDFLSEKTEIYTRTELSLRPVHLLICAGIILGYLFRKKREK